MTRLTLTFDNGPDPDVTPRVLDLLRARGLAAHFFVLGKHVATPAGRRLVERARDEGHLVSNHSYTHEVPLGQEPGEAAVAREIVATEALLAPLALGAPAGLGARRFRPFGGGGAIGPHLFSRAARDHLVREGYSAILWNAVPRDWVDPGWVPTALAQCAALPHAVVVLHDIAGACLPALPAFLDAAAERGWELTPELPGSCVPLREGRPEASFAALVAAA